MKEPRRPPPVPDPLIAEIDAAAARILARAEGSASVRAASGDGERDEDAAPESAPVSLKDQIAAFQAVVAWAETRAKLLKPATPEAEPKGAKFNDLRDRFRGAPPRSGGARGGNSASRPDAED